MSTLRKLRHQNILLFMGACVSPPHFAIVTKFCNGSTLYRHIHVLETIFSMDHIIDMLTQLAQGTVLTLTAGGQHGKRSARCALVAGMEYLHARRVVKRKLTSKSVFVEMDSKVMIGDFSLATMSGLPVPGSPRPRFQSTGK
jgi:serine/threonine protein kinase